ncbi:uncharacterized protein LY89DRAFT_717194 [Mollisia scopiformis]|uniref:PHD-type domain-containing protein n=1 Tax=Mollisia scopiformis TaxID=149040 RepID=A0A194XEN6_MOLSC|nr:uncharacterized protein LY89DRAFT_717194 [Mollisia scopiformis]KUJ18611.1 hypothetical protein LY89DRAFT_717194 [Mollisia scopiformis]
MTTEILEIGPTKPMASKENPNKRGRGQACNSCRKNRVRCVPSEASEAKAGACGTCLDAGLKCSSSASGSGKAKRAIEAIGHTLNRESIESNRTISSTTVSLHLQDSSMDPLPKKTRKSKTTQPPQKQDKSPNACGICLQDHVSSGETKGDKLMLRCDIKSCSKWYHSSCVQFKNRGNQIFHSFETGGKKSTFFCSECYNPKRKDLLNAVAQAESDFKETMERIKQTIITDGAWPPKTLVLSTEREQDNSPTFQRDASSLEILPGPKSNFDPAREDKYQSFQMDCIESLLRNIEQAVYDYNREIGCANDLFLDQHEVFKLTPLKFWHQIDPGCLFTSGKAWFQVDGTANNLSVGHAPITAALRRMLGTPDDQSLHISLDLEELSFSHVHTALINWFVVDILGSELNIYQFPNMKPLRATQAAIANFGDARWKGNGQSVLREIKLRAWHKNQFREEVIEKVGWQGELIRRFEGFLAPMTKNSWRIDPRSESRANIIKHTIELWSYLDAAHGTLEIIHPSIGAAFDGRTCESTDEEHQSRSVGEKMIKWVLRRGFRFEELGSGGRPMAAKAIVISQ